MIKNLINLVKGIEILMLKYYFEDYTKIEYLEKILSQEASIETEYVDPKYGNEKLILFST